MRWLVILLVSLSGATRIKDLKPALSGLSKVYSGVPFRKRMEVMALAIELQGMDDASKVDYRHIGSKYDSAGLIPVRKQMAYFGERDELEETVLPPLKKKTPIEILLTFPRIDSLHLTMEEHMALSGIVKIVADTGQER